MGDIRVVAPGDVQRFLDGQPPAFNKGLRALDPTVELAKLAASADKRRLYRDSFALWASHTNLRVAGRPFSFDRRRYLIPIYSAREKNITWMKAAQLGATTYLLTYLVWWPYYHAGKAGLYFPTEGGLLSLSRDRLKPIIESIPPIARSLTNDPTNLGLKQFRGAFNQEASLYLLYIAGKATRDSTPLDLVAFDERRLMKDEDVEQAQIRINGSDIQIEIYTSTPKYPDADIHMHFLEGTQEFWTTKCQCPDGVVLAETFPDCCIVTDDDAYYRCPRCKTRIVDPQVGNFVARNPRADARSFQVGSMISPTMSVRKIWKKYNTRKNPSEFVNGYLGLPYIDKEAMPVTDEILQKCVDPNARWGANDSEVRKSFRGQCAIGMDHHPGNAYVVVMRLRPDGLKEIVHAELIERGNPRYGDVTPFVRAREIFKEYDVQFGIVDALPNANEAMDLARAFPRRVFLSWYREEGTDMVRWLDRAVEREEIRKGSTEIRFKWQVILHRYLSIDWTLSDFIDRSIVMPDPRALEQKTRARLGRFENEALGLRLWKHYKGVARKQIPVDEKLGKYRMGWEYVSSDPHFLHATNYANVALERLRRRGTWTM